MNKDARFAEPQQEDIGIHSRAACVGTCVNSLAAASACCDSPYLGMSH